MFKKNHIVRKSPYHLGEHLLGTNIKKAHFLCLISFHANANGNPLANGFGVFYWHSSVEGKRLDKIWNKNAGEILPIGAWGTGPWESIPNDWTNFYILRATPIPAILPEHFLFTNPNELKKCNTKEFMRKPAEVTVKSLCEYVGKDYRAMYSKEKTSAWAEEGYYFVTENNISDGARPKDHVTREEIWAILYRFKKTLK